MFDRAPCEFTLPDLGEGLEDATIVRWLVDVGETVALNQPLCCVETAKAEVEIPSPHAGTVVELGGAEGDTLSVGAVLVRIVEDPPPDGTGAPDTQPAVDQGTDAPTPVQPGTDAAVSNGSRAESTLVGYGHDASIDRARRAPAVSARRAVTGPRPLAKPPVRRLARTLGVDLRTVAPRTGPGGIVTRADVEAAARAPAPASTDATGDVEAGDDQVVPVRGVRARIAQRVTRSRQTIPDATCSVVVDCTRLLEVGATLDDAWGRRGGRPVIRPFPLLCSLVTSALRANGRLNATYDDDGPTIRLHRAVHLGIATATPAGLVVPVVRDADERSVVDLALEIERLVASARTGSARPADLAGSTFTVSNFGALGIDEGTPVVNHPEAAILGVGSIRARPYAVDDTVVARQTATFTLVFDHRVCDGAEAAGFLRDLRDLVETPELLLLPPSAHKHG
jgi:pyruvate dehydrogenase E2 component (dihydrolipoamide acetyltransferase)